MNIENTLQAMKYWAMEHNLEEEFSQEILQSSHLDKWILNDCLIKRFGYFVLENSDAKDILYHMGECSKEEKDDCILEDYN